MPYRDEGFACPACSEPMAAAGGALPPGASVNVCRACGGTWADAAASQTIATTHAPTLEAVDESANVNVNASASASGAGASRAAVRACPVCGDPLERVVVAQTELDACARHGTFFDRAELGRVLRILARQRNLVDPTWSSGDDMRWVSGNTGLTRPVLSPDDLKERQSQADWLDLTEAAHGLVTWLWSAVTRKEP